MKVGAIGDILELAIEHRGKLSELLDISTEESSEGELAAMVSFAIAFPDGFMALVDTYDVKRYSAYRPNSLGFDNKIKNKQNLITKTNGLKIIPTKTNGVSCTNNSKRIKTEITNNFIICKKCSMKHQLNDGSYSKSKNDSQSLNNNNSNNNNNVVVINSIDMKINEKIENQKLDDKKFVNQIKKIENLKCKCGSILTSDDFLLQFVGKSFR